MSSDVMVVRGLEQRDRENFLLWQEGRAPQVVIEVTSPPTRDEDLEDKFEVCRDEIEVAEYFLFDPRGEYLDPVLQGYRLSGGRYRRIKSLAGRLPSEELGLQLEADGNRLRFYDPTGQRWLPTLEEARLEELAVRRQAQATLQQSEALRRQAEAEAERLRQELAALQRTG